MAGLAPHDLSQCRCGPSLNTAGIRIPAPGFKLYAQCHVMAMPESNEQYGQFFFRGNGKASGTLRIEVSPADGSLGANFFEKSTASDSTDGIHLRFENPSRVVATTGAPRLRAPKYCLEADVIIKFKEVLSTVDGGTDYYGDFARDYRISRIGKFRICKDA